MPSLPTHGRPEIDHRTLRLLVGVIALSLANLTAWLAQVPLASISASYHEGGWAQAVFIGFLYAIAAFLLAYNGLSRAELILSKLAALAALGVAMFPCRCEAHDEIVPYVHAASAAVMFSILAWFCWGFYRRAREKGHPQALVRASLYAICGLVIVGSMAVLGLDGLLGGRISEAIPRLTFYGERAGLMAFGVCWLTASRVLPGITRPDERFSPMGGAHA